jgi:hypothetical protein
MRVVHGRNTIPRAGRTQLSKMRLNLAGETIHQIIVAILGPRRSIEKNTHIGILKQVINAY